MVVTSEALGTCVRLAQGRYSAMRRPGVEPATCWLHDQRSNHYTTEPPININVNLLTCDPGTLQELFKFFLYCFRPYYINFW